MADLIDDPRNLCARNLSAACREAANAHLAARAGGAEGDLTADLIARACELLERALKRVFKPAEMSIPPPSPATESQPPEPEPSPVPTPPAVPTSGARAPA